MIKNLNYNWILNIIVIVVILILPYYLFSGKLYVGGDDTRLMYSYPAEYLRNVTFSSWNNFSTLGWNSPSQFLAPLVSIWYLLSLVIKSKIIISYFAFSAPLIIGFVYFQKFIGELVADSMDKYWPQIFAGSLFYILSPILAYQLLFIFLTTVWLIALAPIVFYYFLKYLKTSKFEFIFKCMIAITILPFVILSMPWLLGFLAPLLLSMLLFSFLYSKKEVIYFLKKLFIFFGVILLSQAFWFIGFAMTYLQVSSNSFAAKVFSSSFQDTFTPTILATARGSIFYPLLNLINRQLAFDNNWDLKNIFLQYYDKTLWINVIFLISLFIGVTNLKKYTNKNEKRIFLIFLTAFILLLYFITVNIGPLKDLFIFLRHAPAFTMFRNFYDKFSYGFVFCYSVVMTFCLVIVKRKWPKSRRISSGFLIIFVIVILVNSLPLKKMSVAPLWTTKDTYKTINFPSEYTSFMSDINRTISPTNNMLTVPFGTAIYSVVKDDSSNNVYVGTSPVMIFSGVNDISGPLSFNFTKEASTVDKLILNKNYKDFDKMLFDHNINYVVLTKNVPDEVKKSYVFDLNMLAVQDRTFIKEITNKRLLTSSKGNYELYEAKNKNTILSSDNLSFQRVSPVKYRLYIGNIRNKQDLVFLDSFHEGWKLYSINNSNNSFCDEKTLNLSNKTSECKKAKDKYDIGDVSYLIKKPVFVNTHKPKNNFSNEWNLDPEFIKNHFSKDQYKINKDGSIDIELVLYFYPQSYFYLGILISLIVFAVSIFILIKEKYVKKNR